MKLKHYRIVRDRFKGYEVQVWRIWWPFWEQAGTCNTHETIEQAREFALLDSKPVVEYLP